MTDSNALILSRIDASLDSVERRIADIGRKIDQLEASLQVTTRIQYIERKLERLDLEDEAAKVFHSKMELRLNRLMAEKEADSAQGKLFDNLKGESP